MTHIIIIWFITIVCFSVFVRSSHRSDFEVALIVVFETAVTSFISSLSYSFEPKRISYTSSSRHFRFFFRLFQAHCEWRGGGARAYVFKNRYEFVFGNSSRLGVTKGFSKLPP